MEGLKRFIKDHNDSERNAVPEKGSVEVLSGPIYTCVGSPDTYPEETVEYLDGVRTHAEQVDYYANPARWKSNNQRNGGVETSYVISDLNDRDKYSDRYLNCTGLVAVGTDTETGRNISILTHQDPAYVLASKQHEEVFFEHVFTSLDEVRRRSRVESVSVVLFGGDYSARIGGSVVRERRLLGKARDDDYADVIHRLGEISTQVFQIDPRVVVGPKEASWRDVSAIFVTQLRRLYLYRPWQEGTENNVDYLASDVDKIMPKINPKT